MPISEERRLRCIEYAMHISAGASLEATLQTAKAIETYLIGEQPPSELPEAAASTADKQE